MKQVVTGNGVQNELRRQLKTMNSIVELKQV